MNKIEFSLDNFKLFIQFRKGIDLTSENFVREIVTKHIHQYKNAFALDGKSELSIFNRSLKEFSGSEYFFHYLMDSIYWFAITDGVFNPFAILPLREDFLKIKNDDTNDYLFKLSQVNADFPKTADNLTEYIDIDYINGKVKFIRPIKIDFSGISKGILVDSIVKDMINNFDDFSISFGGDNYFKSDSKQHNWDFEFKSMINSKENESKLIANNEAISISGNTGQNSFIDDLSKYQLIDPITKENSNSKISIVIIKADNCTTSDVLAKSFLIADVDTREKLSKKFKNINRVEIDLEGNIIVY